MTRDIPVFDIAQAAHIGAGAALAFTGNGGEGHTETPGYRQSSSDSEAYVRGDWSWKPVPKNAPESWFERHPAKDDTGIRPAPGMEFVALSQRYRRPGRKRLLGELPLMRYLHNPRRDQNSRHDPRNEWRADAFAQGAGVRVREQAKEGEKLLVTMEASVKETSHD